MKFGPIPTHQAEGTIIAHKLYDAHGKRLINKGKMLSQQDVALLQEHGFESVIVAQLEDNDLHENTAAARVGHAIAGDGIKVQTPGVGRANLIATERGPLRVNVPALTQLNNIYDGITIATMREHTLVEPGDLITLVKIVPFGVPEARVIDVERTAQESGWVLGVRPLQHKRVAMIVSAPEPAQEKLRDDFLAPVRDRIEFLGSELVSVTMAEHTEEAVANAIGAQPDADMIIVTSVSAVIDHEDVVPSAMMLAGGQLTHFGVPVDPGTMMCLGYLHERPIIGAPGCIKSRKTNVIDHLLPRLLSGERLTRADMVSMGHGGLLKDDILERPMPRRATTVQEPVPGGD